MLINAVFFKLLIESMLLYVYDIIRIINKIYVRILYIFIVLIRLRSHSNVK